MRHVGCVIYGIYHGDSSFVLVLLFTLIVHDAAVTWTSLGLGVPGTLLGAGYRMNAIVRFVDASVISGNSSSIKQYEYFHASSTQISKRRWRDSVRYPGTTSVHFQVQQVAFQTLATCGLQYPMPTFVLHLSGSRRNEPKALSTKAESNSQLTA